MSRKGIFAATHNAILSYADFISEQYISRIRGGILIPEEFKLECESLRYLNSL